mmetsp:Transcript_8532/g.22794  ORF Transcript_8532/g.22794 Transcript_8532/m.22794 type:complete len:285 (-) Transcript_8532:32-886(-)
MGGDAALAALPWLPSFGACGDRIDLPDPRCSGDAAWPSPRGTFGSRACVHPRRHRCGGEFASASAWPSLVLHPGGSDVDWRCDRRVVCGHDSRQSSGKQCDEHKCRGSMFDDRIRPGAGVDAPGRKRARWCCGGYGRGVPHSRGTFGCNRSCVGSICGRLLRMRGHCQIRSPSHGNYSMFCRPSLQSSHRCRRELRLRGVRDVEARECAVDLAATLVACLRHIRLCAARDTCANSAQVASPTLGGLHTNWSLRGVLHPVHARCIGVRELAVSHPFFYPSFKCVN